MKKFGIPCPAVQVLNKHILVMSFIGKDQCPAPKLKDVKLPVQDLEDAYDQVIGVSLDLSVYKS
jgi:RIO kinase 3